MGAPWRTEDETRIRNLIAGGLTLAEIGRALGRTPGAIKSRCNRLGIPTRAPRDWPHPYLKDLDGPPIRTDKATENFTHNAVIGSAKLLAEIERVFGKAA